MTELFDTIPEHDGLMQSDRIGVLIVNLGTPDSCATSDVRRYLREFLTDPRVIEINPLPWRVLLELIILPVRGPKSAKKYQSIWDRYAGDSPLRILTELLSRKIQKASAKKYPHLQIDYAMRYGRPSIISKLEKFRNDGCRKMVILPIYPQYSATTTASVVDVVNGWMKSLRWQPTVRFCSPYYDHELYLNALLRQLKSAIEENGKKFDHILLSFHGLPKRNLERGDPYYCHCHKTTRLLRERLGMDEQELSMSFQSRFGVQDWLTPYTHDRLSELASEGKRNILVQTPGFSTDCLETLEEVAIDFRDEFIKAGGKSLTVLPCLNDADDAVDLYMSLIRNELAGWCTDLPQKGRAVPTQSMMRK